MDNFNKLGGWWEQPKQRWYLGLLEDLRSNITWGDLLFGILATAVIAFVLIGFSFQTIPDYKVGQIAYEDFRAFQDAKYEDAESTALKRAEAAAGVPAVYYLDTDLIAGREKAIAAAFSEARGILSQSGATQPQTKASAVEELELFDRLRGKIRTFPPRAFPVLLKQRFNPNLEKRLLKILDAVLRDGIIEDRGKFIRDQKTGIIIRDRSYPFEHPLADVNLARDIPAAQEYLRQFPLDLPDLSERDKAVLIRYLETALFPTLVIHETETAARRAAAAARVQPVEVQIKQGQTIAHVGEQITPAILSQLTALRNLQKPRSLIWQFSGYFIIVAILVYSLWRYLVHYQKRHRQIRRYAVLILTVVALELLLTRLVTLFADILGNRFQRFQENPSSLYYGIPFAFGVLLITLLVDVNLGILSCIMLAILAGFFYNDVNLAAYLIIGCFAGIYSIRQYKDRAAILKAGLTIGIVNAICLAGLIMLHQTGLTFSVLLNQLSLALLSGILASALVSILLPAFEYLFKIVTDIRLLELANLNAPTLRKLSVAAPGTYHHSLMVATLAEAAAESIGANPLIVRVAAYYHDAGKMLHPEYFVENQNYGGNMHEDISPSASYHIIASHIKNGLQLANEIGLPQQISDVIPQHHGTRVMTFFFHKAKDSVDGKIGDIIEADFRYPGPKPQTKEAAIVMLADSVEAASRTLTDPTPAQIQGMMHRLVDGIVSDNQLNECDITLKDVQRVKESFCNILTGIFHHRIDYPGYDFKRVREESEKNAVQDPDHKKTEAV
jgi:cyclic-di-AMP phosphodiesterase PgpH